MASSSFKSSKRLCFFISLKTFERVSGKVSVGNASRTISGDDLRISDLTAFKEEGVCVRGVRRRGCHGKERKERGLYLCPENYVRCAHSCGLGWISQ